MMEDCKSLEKNMAVTFIDLKNAFGSVSHTFLLDMLFHLKIPSQIIRYIKDMYSNLSTYFSTKYWSTEPIAVTRGIYQGDTLSPILFLLTFSPVIEYIKSLPIRGYSISLKVPKGVGVPPVGASLYIEWLEVDSIEPQGWYLCYLNAYVSDGRAKIIYKNSDRELIDLTTVRWYLTRKNSKPYLPFSITPPYFPLKQMRSQLNEEKYTDSHPHKIKAYADDLTYITTTKIDHQKGLSAINSKCESLDLQIRPDKCYSLYIKNGKVLPSEFWISYKVY